jgi:hypothetical protein
MENLNNENTWDELRVQFPSATRLLSIYIEDYYKHHGAITWDYFESVPFDVQVGIIISFYRTKELLSTKLGRACESIPLFKIHLHDRLGMLEEIVNRKIDL